jgi:hypothetical protein
MWFGGGVGIGVGGIGVGVGVLGVDVGLGDGLETCRFLIIGKNIQPVGFAAFGAEVATGDPA